MRLVAWERSGRRAFGETVGNGSLHDVGGRSGGAIGDLRAAIERQGERSR